MSAFLTWAVAVHAQNGRQNREEDLKRFDKDGDGRLSREEADAMRKALRSERANRGPGKGKPFESDVLKAEVMTLPKAVGSKMKYSKPGTCFFHRSRRMRGPRFR